MADLEPDDQDDDFLNDDPLPQDQDPDDAGDWDDDDNSNDLTPCPFCRRPLYHDAAVCPGCGNFVDLDQQRSRKSLWIFVGVLLGIIAILATLVLWLLQCLLP